MTGIKAHFHRLGIAFFGIGLLCTACGKDNTEKHVIRLSQDFKDYTLYAKGSYWVYGDTASTKTDSIYLYDKETYDSKPSDQSYGAERFDTKMVSTRIGDMRGYGGVESELAYQSYEATAVNGSWALGVQFFTPAKIGDKETIHGELIYSSHEDSVQIHGVTYKDVRVFKYPSKTQSYLFRDIYWARNVGIIRQVTFEGQVWDLLRYKVVR